MKENALETQLNKEVEEYKEIEENINNVRQQILEGERELIFRQGRIDLLKEQLDETSTEDNPSE